MTGKQRRRRDDKPSLAIVVSYVPLLVDRPGFCSSPDDPEFARVLRLMESCPDGHVDGCLWMMDGGHAVPVFIMKRAREIADHLRAWSEGNPGDWFRLCFAESRGRYVAVLFPDLDRSVRRFQETYRILTGKTLKLDQYRVLHVPLGFVSGREHIFPQVRCQIANRTMLGFVDSSAVDRNAPLETDPAAIDMVGPFQVCWDCKPFGMDISGMVEERVAEAEVDEETRKGR